MLSWLAEYGDNQCTDGIHEMLNISTSLNMNHTECTPHLHVLHADEVY